ncbi:MAG: hypothetical protein Q4A06_05465 [Cardiobacteriaceae bacterium]|nr:hypothetical protein [Cardiobacteriaceae bacterium]
MMRLYRYDDFTAHIRILSAQEGGRLRPGVRFYCHEGSKHVAIGEVAAITGLHLPRASQNIS